MLYWHLLLAALPALAVGVCGSQLDICLRAGLQPLQRGFQCRQNVVGAVQVGAGVAASGGFQFFAGSVLQRVMKGNNGVLADFHCGTIRASKGGDVSMPGSPGGIVSGDKSRHWRFSGA